MVLPLLRSLGPYSTVTAEAWPGLLCRALCVHSEGTLPRKGYWQLSASSAQGIFCHPPYPLFS